MNCRLAIAAAAVAAGIASVASADDWRIFPDDVRTVGVVSVSDIVGQSSFARTTNELTKAGYRLKVMPNVLGKKADAETRARMFERAWMDPEIDLLIFSRGGQGAVDVIDRIDWEKLRGRDMRVIGFSDVTLVLNTMLRHGVGRPMTGPMLSTLGSYATPATRKRMRAAMDGRPKEVRLRPVRAASAPVSGKPMGGLLDRIVKLAEAGKLPSAEGRIVFLENTPKYAEKAEEMLDRLIALKVFDKAAAVVFCDFNRKDPKERTEGLIADFAGKVACPVFRGYPYGHVPESSLLDFTRPLTLQPDGVLK